jgi:hypothetical protein
MGDFVEVNRVMLREAVDMHVRSATGFQDVVPAHQSSLLACRLERVVVRARDARAKKIVREVLARRGPQDAIDSLAST